MEKAKNKEKRTIVTFVDGVLKVIDIDDGVVTGETSLTNEKNETVEKTDK